MQRRIDIASRQHDDRTVPGLGLSRQKCRKRDRPARFDDKLVLVPGPPHGIANAVFAG